MADVKVFKTEDLNSIVDLVVNALKEKQPTKKEDVVKNTAKENPINLDSILVEATKLGEELAKEVIKTLEKTPASDKKETPKKCECEKPTVTKMNVEASVENAFNQIEKLTNVVKELTCRLEQLENTVDALITDVESIKDETACCCDEDCCYNDCDDDEECGCCCDDEEDECMCYENLLEWITTGLSCVNCDRDLYGEDYVDGYKSAMAYLVRNV